MPIPDNITKESILKAIEEINLNGVPKTRVSKDYDITYEDRRYPPKYVISLANKYVNGKELSFTAFNGGKETNLFLINRGFVIIRKDGTRVVY